MAHWFTKEHPRQIKARSAVLLVGKNKSKRIKIPCTYIIENESGDPEKIQEAAEFVMRHGNEVKLTDYSVSGCNITMGDPNLFRKKPVEAPKCEIKNFTCKHVGDSDEPDTALEFAIYAPFSTDLWNWLGQQGGETFTMAFDYAPLAGDVVVANDKQETLVLEGQEETSSSDEQEDDKEDGEDEDPDKEADEEAPQSRELSAGEASAFQRARAANSANKESQSSIAKRAAEEARAPRGNGKPKLVM